MIELTNTTAQTVQPGQSLTFDSVVLKSGCAETHRSGGGTITLRAKCAVYEVHFSGNVSSATIGPVQLAIMLDGEVLPETTMDSTTTTVGDFNNVSTTTLLRTDCCCGRLSVANTGTANPVTVGEHPAFFVKRIG